MYMTIAKNRIGGLIFLALSLAYGYSITLIPMYPGDEYEVFTAKTLPAVLAILGVILSLSLLFSSRGEQKSALPKLDWAIAAKLNGINGRLRLSVRIFGFLNCHHAIFDMRLLAAGRTAQKIDIFLLATVSDSILVWTNAVAGYLSCPRCCSTMDGSVNLCGKVSI